MISLAKERVFCFTATLTDYWKVCFCAAFRLPLTVVKQFHTAKYYKTGVENKQQIVVSVRDNKPQALTDLVRDIVEKAIRQPVLVFLSNDDPLAT